MIEPAAEIDTLEELLRSALAPRFVVLRLIGAGGMARVYLARESALKRLVAVKVLAPHIGSSDEARVRFEREAQAVASLSHPNIVAIHGVGELPDGTPYFVMQYVNGQSLAARIDEQGPLSVGEARRVIGEVAAALAAAHEQGIVHRDIKAANILLEDATGRVLVSDFGIAAVAPRDEPAPARLTGTGVVVGTPMYMSPEQLLSEPVTERTDVYALGLLAHELITGHGPFVASTPGEIIAAHLRDTPPRLSEKRPGVDAELDELVARCLEKDASKRPTASDVANRLLPSRGALLEWPPPGLDDALGGMRHVARSLWFGGIAVLGGLVPELFGSVRMRPGASSGLPIMLAALVLIGLVSLAIGVRRVARAGVLARRAIRAGYGWNTVLEVLSDRAGDTAALIAGTREYAALPVEERNELRRRRILAALLFLAGGALLVPALFVAITLGSSGAGDSVIWACEAIPLAAGVAALVMDLRELRLFALRRRARVAEMPEFDTSALVRPWYDSFEAARGTQRLGRGPSARASAGRTIGLVAAGVAAVCALILTPLVILQIVMPTFWVAFLPRFSNATAKVEIASTMRPYALPVDPAVNALDAGRALAGLYQIRNSPFPMRADVPRLAIPDWRATVPPNLFPAAAPDQFPGLPATSGIITAAAHGLSVRELEYLERIAHAPIWAAYHRVAVAPKIDYVAAAFALPFPDSLGLTEFPIPVMGDVKALAQANVARAAYYLARQQRDSAELALREVVSFGFEMIDHSDFLIEQIVGAVIVGTGRQALIDFYTAIGDGRGAAIRQKHDSVLATIGRRTEADDSNSVDAGVDWRDPAAVRARFIATVRDTTVLRGIRKTMLHELGAASCTNVRELVFGPEPDVRGAYASALRTLAKTKSDSAMIELSQRIERLRDERPTMSQRLITVGARGLAVLLANPRIGDCDGVFAFLIAPNR